MTVMVCMATDPESKVTIGGAGSNVIVDLAGRPEVSWMGPELETPGVTIDTPLTETAGLASWRGYNARACT